MRPYGQRRVDLATVVGHDVLYITDILEPPFDLERSDARVEQLADMRRKVQVAHRQQVFPGNIGTSPAVGQVVSQAARLAARPAESCRCGRTPTARGNSGRCNQHRSPRGRNIPPRPRSQRRCPVFRRAKAPVRGSPGRTHTRPGNAPGQVSYCTSASKHATRPAGSCAASAMSCTISASTPAAISSRACRPAASSSSS